MSKHLYPIRRAETGAQVGELPYPFVLKQMKLNRCSIEWVDNHWLITGEPNRMDLMPACAAIMESNRVFEGADWAQEYPKVTVVQGSCAAIDVKSYLGTEDGWTADARE